MKHVPQLKTSTPRVVVAGTASNVGKTTVCAGIIAALRARGLRVAAFKCGPDYLDPTVHAAASGGPSHNLDGWMMGRAAVQATFAEATREADIAVIEGVMGLFDGASVDSEAGSTAEIAKWLAAPVVLVVEASGMARSVAAMVHGYDQFDAQLQLGAVVCNRVGSVGHLDLLRRASARVPVLGGLLVDEDGEFPSRHLGLVAARGQRHDAAIECWRQHVEAHVDVDAIIELARRAPPIEYEPVRRRRQGVRCRIGLARDEAFHFYYPYNLLALERAGATLVPFSPVHDRELPDVDGIMIGGGYPELFAAKLAANDGLRASLQHFAASGRPIYGECGGLMLLVDAIECGGKVFPMMGLLPGRAVMRDRLCALGYVEVETTRGTLLGPPGQRFRGHQFRYSELVDVPAHDAPYRLLRRRDGAELPAGSSAHAVLASYVHVHFASNPALAGHFVDACVSARSRACPESS